MVEETRASHSAVGFSGALWETWSVVSGVVQEFEIVAQGQFDDGARRTFLSQRLKLHGKQHVTITATGSQTGTTTITNSGFMGDDAANGGGAQNVKAAPERPAETLSKNRRARMRPPLGLKPSRGSHARAKVAWFCSAAWPVFTPPLTDGFDIALAMVFSAHLHCAEP